MLDIFLFMEHLEYFHLIIVNKATMNIVKEVFLRYDWVFFACMP